MCQLFRNKFIGCILIAELMLLVLAAFFAFPAQTFAQKAEFMVFGPYVPLNAGKYKVSYRLKVRDNKNNKPVVTLSVVARDATKLLALQDLKGTDFAAPGEYRDFDLEFSTSGERDFEFRVRYLGNRGLFVDKISLTQLEKWSQQETEAGSLIKGSVAPSVVSKSESFLGSAKSVEIEAENPILKFNIGKRVTDLDASGGKALLGLMPKTAPPSSASAAKGLQTKTAKLPKIEISEIRIPKIKLESTPQFLVGFAVGALFAAIFIYLTRKFVILWLAKMDGKRDENDSSSPIGREILFKSLKYLFSRLFNKYVFASIFLIMTVTSIFFENISLFHFVIRTEYLLLLFLLFCVVFGIDSRLSIGSALVLLMTCPFLLILHYEVLAENVAVYAYYFLVIGVVFQIVEYVKEARHAKQEILAEVFTVETASAPEGTTLGEKEISEDKDILHRRVDFLVEMRAVHQRKVKIGRRRKALAIVLMLVGLFAASVFLWPVLNSLRMFRFSDASGERAKTIAQKRVSHKKSQEKKSESEVKSIASSLGEKSQIEIEVLNGNGIQGEAAKIGTKFGELGFNVLRTKNANRFDYSNTLIRHKPGLKDVAELVAKEIAGSYTTIFCDDLPSSYEADIVVILGRKSK